MSTTTTDERLVLPPLTEEELFRAYGNERPGDWSVEDAESEQEPQRPEERD